MNHFKEYNKLMEMYFEAKKDGGDLYISWSFMDQFRSKIGDQWYRLAEVIFYFETIEKVQLI